MGLAYLIHQRADYVRSQRTMLGDIDKFARSICRHPKVEQVEIGDGILVPREVVAKICTECYQGLPADYSSPHSAVMTDEESIPFLYHLSHWAEKSERLATRKEAGTCHE
jgi:hypothetical protein